MSKKSAYFDMFYGYVGSADIGLEPVGSTPQVLDAQIRKELKKWADVIKRLGIEAEAL